MCISSSLPALVSAVELSNTPCSIRQTEPLPAHSFTEEKLNIPLISLEEGKEGGWGGGMKDQF